METNRPIKRNIICMTYFMYIHIVNNFYILLSKAEKKMNTFVCSNFGVADSELGVN